jgi:peptidoglycan hydrolase-like protein with peptidoglycan-binding domain
MTEGLEADSFEPPTTPLRSLPSTILPPEIHSASPRTELVRATHRVTDTQVFEAQQVDDGLDLDGAESSPTGTTKRRGRRSKRGAGGSKRSKYALFVVGAALASAAGGLAVGKSLKSPADAASDRAAPTASRITVPIEKRVLSSSLAVAGDISFEDPSPIRLAGSVGASAGTTQVITRVPESGATVDEGLALFEISGRPVFVFLGTLPTYRSLEPGTTGPDVLQLEQALERLGFSPGTVDEVFDNGTELAIDAFYLAKGYASEGPTTEERERLRTSRKAVTEAEKQLRDAQVALDKGGKTSSDSETLRLKQELQRAQEAIPEAEAKAAQDNTAAQQEVNVAVGTRDNAKVLRDASVAKYNLIAAVGAINPATGEVYSALEINDALVAKTEQDQALLLAEQGVTQKVNEQKSVAKQGDRDVRAARDALALAQASINDANRPPDTTALSEAVVATQAALDQANADLYTAEGEIGTTVPAGEMVFVPLLPTNVTNVAAVIGTALSAGTDLATVSSTATQITGRVAKNDTDLIVAGTPVEIQVRDTDVTTTGVLTEIRKPKSTADPNNPGAGGGDDAGRLEIVVTPDDPAVINGFVGYSVRISVAVSSTAGEVLAVPVAAVSVGPDGESRIEIERRRARGNDEGETELVPVVVGLAAQGFVEITPIGDAKIAAGDKVVVGSETGQRRTRTRRNTTDTTATDGSASTDGSATTEAAG